MTHAVNRNLEIKLISIFLKQKYFATIQNEEKKREYYSSFFFRKTGSNICKERHTILTLLKWKISARDVFTASELCTYILCISVCSKKTQSRKPRSLDSILFMHSFQWTLTDLACEMFSMVTVPVYDTHGPKDCIYIINHGRGRRISPSILISRHLSPSVTIYD